MSDLMFAAENKFSFNCPIFGTETRFSACMKLRDMVWKGQQVEIRRGCQAAMMACKCPVTNIVQKAVMSHDEKQETRYAAREPVVGKLHADVLAAILPVIVTEMSMVRYAVGGVERELLASSNTRIEAQLGVAPSKEKPTRRATNAPPPEAHAPKTKTVKTTIQTAAETGDLSAAIS